MIGALEATLGSHARVLNRHYDAQHNRCVFTIAAEPPKLVEALLAGAEHAIDLIDMRRHQGLHPHIGALDVCPVVWQADERHRRRGRGSAEDGRGDRRPRHPRLLLRRAGHAALSESSGPTSGRAARPSWRGG